MKRRECDECVAYYNMIDGSHCGLGFRVVEEIEGGDGTWEGCIRPFEGECKVLDKLPVTKEDFVAAAASRGIEWDIDEVCDVYI